MMSSYMKSKIRVVQVRSSIKSKEAIQETLKCLGLGKIGRAKIIEDSPSTRGMINKVRHLIVVNEI